MVEQHNRPIIYWFRQDLRLTDNSGFRHAIDQGVEVLPLYVWDEHLGGQWSRGSASRWWLHHSLDSLKTSIEKAGANLVLRQGETLETLLNVVKEVDAQAVYFSRHYEPWSRELEALLHEELTARDVDCKRFAGHLLHEPEDITKNTGGYYKVFTPFWKAMQKRPVKSAAAKIQKIPKSASIPSTPIENFQLLPTKPNWAENFIGNPGEQGAIKLLKTFVRDSIQRYATERDIPSSAGTSQLSAHLHFGEISPRFIWHYIEKQCAENSALKEASEPYLRQLAWRDFSNSLLFFHPDFAEKPFNKQFANFPWKKNEQFVKKWQQGNTGIPIVDAGMRELWHTGWMHNRVRMIVASLLVKNMLVPWQLGESWFWDTLVDADLANNAAGWQWVAGSGADAAPYFRIFNPVSQSERFDPRGEYIRQWVPELAELPSKYIHAPWLASKDILNSAHIVLGKTYPHPIVDLKITREEALNAYKLMREST